MPSIFELLKQIQSASSSVTGPVTHLAVGLGNPGSEYENTRHNAGFIAIDRIAASLHTEIRQARFQALVAEATVGQSKILLMKPQTYMNASGEAVAAAASFYKIPPENILVFSDDVNLDVGRTRIRKNGSDGGQKGLRSIIKCLGTDAFPRMRIGVGKKPEHWDMVDWVLSRFSSDERKLIDSAAAKCSDALPMILAGQIEQAMGEFNGK